MTITQPLQPQSNNAEKPTLEKRKKPIVPIWALRVLTAAIIVGVVASQAVYKSGFGTACVFGEGFLGFTCPLGYLGMALASKSWLPKLLPGVAVAIVLIILVGRAFCGWICPGSIYTTLRNKIKFQPLRGIRARLGLNEGNVVNHAGSNNHRNNGSLGAASSEGKYISLAVLVGTLVSSYIFGFPVFCLICPIGLTFGTIFAVVRLINSSTPGIELLIFPAMLVIEFFVLRKWCSTICPLGAMYSLFSRFNRTFRLRVLQTKCLITRGVNCKACEQVCPEGINIGKLADEKTGLPECTKCLECYERCPAKAIKLRVL
ncbi:MAG: 4Fe-4S binding protein [Anaerolineae bacterium]|nr:4Fe-4S binding protein [Anaerolineae bacterium]